ncbi:disease resistance protein RPM1-like [Impatiens glandulifera]|uniref:disease resistance protein RPM1-like n=1 Tax=Impatiens glandulifera TaxID=253017 RepID=UPI001FB07DC7|nr:disease resistance protein RPM1-like [Impatiens glandulifera]
MATISVEAAVQMIATFLANETQSMTGVRQRVSSLKDDLEYMHSFLQTAESIDEKDSGLKTWVKQVRDVAYETEDVVEEFLLLLTPPSHHFLRTWLFHIQGLRIRYLLSDKIKLINLKMKGIKERRETFFLPSTHVELGGVKPGHDLRLDALFVKDTAAVGIDDSKSQLITLLNVGDKDLLIVTVVGMGGVGKTTLVRKVYESPAKGHFECQAWITVSKSFTSLELLRASLKSFMDKTKEVGNKELDKMDVIQLIDTLRNYLNQKRYIIVFDDIWSVEAWDHVKFAFPCCSCGSRIIFTTRNGDIASSTEITNHMFNLNPLSIQDSWNLFCMKAFRGDEYKGVCPEEMHDISWSLMKKCGGLPLAIVALGGLLATKEKHVLHWQKILESLSPETRIISGLESLERICLLSYNDLPNHLKCCILYTSMFPEDYIIKRSRLTLLWVSEGFVEDRQGVYTREEVAESYLNELVNRSMIQIVLKNNFNRVKTCQLHDVLRDVLQRKSRDESFSIVLKDGKLLQSSEKIHRVAIYENFDDRQTLQGAKISLFTGLRSLLLFDTSESYNVDGKLLKTYLYGCRSLRVVEIKCVSLIHFPEELTKLIHLKHLSLKWNRHIVDIPDSIRKLRCLEILDLRFCYINHLSQGILALKNLRQLCYHTISDIAVKVPSGIENLRKLEKLIGFEVDRKTVNEIGKLTNLKSLGVVKLTEQNWTQLSPTLEKLKRLTALYLSSRVNDIFERLSLTNISSPPLLLQRLFLSAKLQSLPSWIFCLRDLSKLVLMHSRLENDPLRALQGLENLVVLHLDEESYWGEELSCDIGSYPKLKELHVTELWYLKRIVLTEGAMPRLRELKLRDCPCLETVPTGTEHLRDLQCLSVSFMPEIFSQNIKGPHGQDFWKVGHIPIIKIGFIHRLLKIVELPPPSVASSTVVAGTTAK